MKSKILLTGGSGMLGTEMRNYLDFFAPSHEEMDITDYQSILNYKNKYDDFDTIIHCAAYTDVPQAEVEKDKCFKINVTGTYNMVKAFPNAYFVYISTEHVKPRPVNFYSYTKLWGEEMAKLHSKYLIIRTLFKKNPFDYKYAFFDQFTEGDYVDVITPMIVKEILQESKGVVNLGTGRKTMFELARRTKPDIKGISVKDIKNVNLPNDYL